MAFIHLFSLQALLRIALLETTSTFNLSMYVQYDPAMIVTYQIVLLHDEYIVKII